MRLYRLIYTSTPTREDFVSSAERGRTPPNDPEDVRSWDGLSMFATLAQARRNALRAPHIRSHVAVLDLPGDNTFRVERTLKRPGHHTVWGEANTFLRYVVEVIPL